ncbi:MAG: 3-hydroxyacyl-ACP dehydratase FabZ [Alphaproteobacteria bacterium]|nr:3-hydroxyacyl-ACP dehydratase FabZ [Alphaproteobacteria bacterium]
MSTPSIEKTPTELYNIDINEIKLLIPHRYPFLMIDRMIDVCPGESAVGIKNVSVNENYFQGHFPGKPIMPGVLIIEAMAQTAAALVTKGVLVDKEKGIMPPDGMNIGVYFMTVDEAKFRKPVVPGDVLHLKVSKERRRGPVWKFKGEAFVDGALVCESLFSAMLVE